MRNAELRSFLREARSRCPELTILENEPMSRHCSFRIGGPCGAMLLPSSVSEVETVCALLAEAGEKPLLIGNGTNLLVTDAPLHRIVLRLGEEFSRIEPVGDTALRAESGVTLSRLASFAAARSLAGLEFAHGIPGTLGGAVSMNAGAYGGEMKDVVTSVTYLGEDLSVRETDDAGFSYRHSRFSDTGCIVLGAEVSLHEDDPDAVRERMRSLAERRRSSQPLDMPSAGSTFKRPAGGYAAALIDEAGLKGCAVGGAQVSEKHAGFVVNRGGASFDDVLRLIEHIQNEVYRVSGIELEPEVKIIRE